ncbi:MAG: AAA family ATPase [Atopobiaceae bacterium]
MAGRGYVIDSIEDAFLNGPGDPNLTSIFTGARGTGKTTLLTLLADAAEERGWITARVSSVPGMLEDILQQARRAGKELLDDEPRAHINSIGIGGVATVGWEYESHKDNGLNWRSRLEDLLDALEASGTGLLITIDELQAGFDEMVQLASIYQHLVSEGRKISLLMAGLPYQVSRVLNDKSISFLRRATRYHLGRIDDADIRKALVETIESGGRTIEADALEAAMNAIDGFPFMMQLVGYRMWTQAEGDAINLSAAERGIETAQQEMRLNILETTYRELSDMDIAFIEAMLPDEGPSSTAEIAKRMGKSTGYAAQYRKRLLEEGVIGESGRGKVSFELPGWRTFIEEKLEEEHNL